MAHSPKNLAALCLDHVGAGLFKRMAECVISRHEIPFFSAITHHGSSRTDGVGRSRVGIANHIGLACLFGKAVGTGTRTDEYLLFFVGDIADCQRGRRVRTADRSEEHTSELQSLMRISYAVFCLKK